MYLSTKSECRKFPAWIETKFYHIWAWFRERCPFKLGFNSASSRLGADFGVWTGTAQREVFTTKLTNLNKMQILRANDIPIETVGD